MRGNESYGTGAPVRRPRSIRPRPQDDEDEDLDSEVFFCGQSFSGAARYVVGMLILLIVNLLWVAMQALSKVRSGLEKKKKKLNASTTSGTRRCISVCTIIFFQRSAGCGSIRNPVLAALYFFICSTSRALLVCSCTGTDGAEN